MEPDAIIMVLITLGCPSEVLDLELEELRDRFTNSGILDDHEDAMVKVWHQPSLDTLAGHNRIAEAVGGDVRDDPGFQEFERAVLDGLVPALEATGAVVSLVPTGEVDIKYAVELGLSIMLDKPILAVVQPGMQIPAKLVAVADAIFEAELDTAAGRQDLLGRVTAFTETNNLGAIGDFGPDQEEQ